MKFKSGAAVIATFLGLLAGTVHAKTGRCAIAIPSQAGIPA